MKVVLIVEFNPKSKKSGPRGYGTVYSPIVESYRTNCKPAKVSSELSSELSDKASEI